jgi:nucleoid-associated protein YgaU
VAPRTAPRPAAAPPVAQRPLKAFEKAELQIDKIKDPLLCYFNPTEYSVSKTNDWKYKQVTGTSFAPPEFGGGGPRQLELSLLFDRQLAADDEKPSKSVRESTAILLDAMEVPKEKTGGTPTAVPPFVTFQWGHFVFKGVCTSLTIAFKLFSPVGEPIRADVKLTLKQAEVAPEGQNPTTRSTPGVAVHTVRDGDSLPSISYAAYGDATQWRLIAEANGMDNPMHLRRGASLSVPRLEG